MTEDPVAMIVATPRARQCLECAMGAYADSKRAGRSGRRAYGRAQALFDAAALWIRPFGWAPVGVDPNAPRLDTTVDGVP